MMENNREKFSFGDQMEKENTAQGYCTKLQKVLRNAKSGQVCFTKPENFLFHSQKS